MALVFHLKVRNFTAFSLCAMIMRDTYVLAPFARSI